MPEPDAPSGVKPDPEPGLMEVALLHDLIRWREQLARSIARNNLELRSDQITLSINRILFPLLLLRIAEDRHLVPKGALAGLCDHHAATDLIRDLSLFADALYAETSASLQNAPESLESPGDPVVEEKVISSVLETLLSPGRRYDFRTMKTRAIARVLMQYLTRTIRRSATHQATVVDTHETVVSGGTVIAPVSLIEYMAGQALISARKNRSSREILPVRVFDPACGSGTVLLAAYRHMLDEAGGQALTFDERREILSHSVHGLDISRHAVAVTRMLLFLELCDCPSPCTGPGGFSGTARSVLRELRHTILCGNALIGPEIAGDESWMFCPARNRHTLNPFPYSERFPEIVAAGGFDLVVCNPPEGSLEPREWIQQYFQRHYAVYHPLIDRSAYFFEKSLSLFAPGGVVAMCMSGRWLHGSAGSPLREALGTRQIEEIVDLSLVPAGNPGAGLCLLRVVVSPPARPLQAVLADATFPEDPDAYVAAHRFPVDQQLLDAGGWSLRDTRPDEILRKVNRFSTPLENVVMGEVHDGIRIEKNDPFVIDGTLAREWLRRDPRCKPLLRPIITAGGSGHYRAGPAERFLILIPRGWSHAHPGAVKKPWQWFRHRHPFIARHLTLHAEVLKSRAGPEDLWWETDRGEFWEKSRKKILFPAVFDCPVFRFDTGRGIGDETMLALPSAGLYLAGILNSRLMAFIFAQSGRQPGQDIKFSWEDLRELPIRIPDPDNTDDQVRYMRLEKFVQKRRESEKNFLNAETDPERDALQKKIRAMDRQIDALVYALYGLTPEEVALVEETVGRDPSAT
jgi:hypothetical protein